MSIPVKVDASEIQVDTAPIPVTMGTSPHELHAAHGVAGGAHGPRPDLDGLRVKFTHRPHIYLIMDGGHRRHIPNPETYNNRFRDWHGVIADNDIDEIPEIRPLQSGAVLIRGNSTPHVYLLDHGFKRHITSPAAMDKYYFNWSRVYVLPQATVDAIPTGSSIS